jgi:putative tricarboxylic transport membrane protein
VPRNVLMPLILLFCIVGTFAINNSLFEVTVMLVAGIVAYLLEANASPSRPPSWAWCWAACWRRTSSPP